MRRRNPQQAWTSEVRVEQGERGGSILEGGSQDINLLCPSVFSPFVSSANKCHWFSSSTEQQRNKFLFSSDCLPLFFSTIETWNVWIFLAYIFSSIRTSEAQPRRDMLNQTSDPKWILLLLSPLIIWASIPCVSKARLRLLYVLCMVLLCVLQIILCLGCLWLFLFSLQCTVILKLCYFLLQNDASVSWPYPWWVPKDLLALQAKENWT